MNLIDQAKNFAINAHNSINQQRKYSNEPYHHHCERVVALLSTITTDEEILSAAWMHDVLEDVAPHNPDFNAEKIRALFGDNICDLVLELTDSDHSVGNRATRKAIDRQRLEKASVKAKTVKLADLIDNFVDIQKNDPGFAKIFARELGLLLPFLAEGDEQLHKQLSELFFLYQQSRVIQD